MEVGERFINGAVGRMINLGDGKVEFGGKSLGGGGGGIEERFVEGS